MRRYLALVALLVGLSAAGRAAAAPSVAVLGIEADDVPQLLAQTLTDALRQRAAASSLRVVPGKDLIEVKMVFGCDGERPSCMASVGKALGADKLLYGTLQKGGNKSDVTVSLKLLDVESATVERFLKDVVPRRQLGSDAVHEVAEAWFAQLLQLEAQPSLIVTSDPSGATVSLDGAPAGQTPMTLRDLSAGAHTIVVSAEARVSITRTVELETGATQELAITLPPSPVVTSPDLRLSPPAGRTAKILGSALFGAGVLAGVVAIVTWSRYDSHFAGSYEQQIQKELTGFAPLASGSETEFLRHPNGCTVPSTLASKNPSLAEQYHHDCSTGSSFAAATTALWVTAGALAAGGVISFVLGTRQAARAKEHTPFGVLRQTLRVAPVLSSQGGGLTAAFEF